MSQVIVHIGVMSVNVNGDTYQDIVTDLLRKGFKSGQIYGLGGENIRYDDKITLGEVNYIIPEGEKMLIAAKIVGTGRVFTVPYNIRGTFRDIYNYAIFLGLPLNIEIIVNGHLVDLDEKVEPYDLCKINGLMIVHGRSTQDIKVRTSLEGEMKIKVTIGKTKAKEILEMTNNKNNRMKLAKVINGEHNVHIYRDDEIIEKLEERERLYIVPDYETLFEGYSASLME